MELQPDGKLSRHLSIALDRQCFSSDLLPIHVPEIKPDKDSNIAANSQIDSISRILEAYATPVRSRISHMMRNAVRLLGTPENSKRITTRRSGNTLMSTRLRIRHISRPGFRSSPVEAIAGMR